MQRSMFCLLATSLIALTFLPNGYTQPSPAYGLVMGALLVVINLWFVVSVVMLLVKMLDWPRLFASVESAAYRSAAVAVNMMDVHACTCLTGASSKNTSHSTLGIV